MFYGKNKQNKLLRNAFFVGIRSQKEQDPDLYQNVTDPENWLLLFSICFC
jgi:hypothetical protein